MTELVGFWTVIVFHVLAAIGLVLIGITMIRIIHGHEIPTTTTRWFCTFFVVLWVTWSLLRAASSTLEFVS